MSNNDKSDVIANRILVRLQNRKGFTRWWLQLDSETKESIKNSMSEIAREVLNGEE